MEKLSYADIVSSLALLIASISLVWNIVKDFILDRVSIDFSIAFGEIGNIKHTTTTLFVKAGSLKPDHKFDNVGTHIKIINTGRRPIVVRSVGGALNSGNNISMVVDGLPKMLNPYEEFSHVTAVRPNFMSAIKNNEIKELWVEDTKGQKWLLSKRRMMDLKETADYINQGKHL